MVAITPRALAVMRRVTAHPSLEPSSGLRIARRESAGPLQVRAANGPQEGDSVMEREGARLFLGPEAVRRLEGRELDAVTEPDGKVQFILKAAA